MPFSIHNNSKQATMDWPTMEQELAASRHAIEQLQEQLHEKEMTVRGLEVAILHHVQKGEELEAILEAKDSGSGGLENELKVKALQNASLAVEVEDMRDRLKKVSRQRESLEAELTKMSNKVKRLEGERRSHQRMLVEMGDVVRMLGRFDIDYSKHGDSASISSDPERSFDSIKLKIRAIEEDRQKLIQGNQDLQTELFEKMIAIDSYKNQAALLKAAKVDRDRLALENKQLQEDCDEKDAIIKSLKKSLADANRVSGPIPTGPIPKSIEYKQESGELHKECELSQYTSMEIQLQEDGSVMVTPSVQCDLVARGKQPEEDAISFSSLESPPQDESENKSSGLPRVIPESNFYEEMLEEEVAKLKEELEKSHLEVKMAKKKQDLREKMLRDVIFQYKELQKELDTTSAQLNGMRGHPHDEIDPAIDSTGKQNNRDIHTKTTPKQASTATLEESSTFDTAEMSANTSNQAQSLSASATGSVHTRMTGIKFDVAAHSDDDYLQLQKEVARLEHQYEDAIARITNLEEDLDSTKGELASVQAQNIVKQNELIELQHKHDQLHTDYQTAMENTVRLQNDLEFAQEQARKAREQRDDREKDLWDVIDQYKELTVENENKFIEMQGVETELGRTQALMASVKQELYLTKRHIKRKDLVYDHMRMKQELEDFTLKVETLERNLMLAKSEAARNKEEGKGTRNRLVGCHFQHRKLQMEYEEMVVQKANLERDLNRTKRQLQVQKSQHDSWKEKLSNLREKREEAAMKHRKLLEENTELKAYCNELLNLASKSIEAL